MKPYLISLTFAFLATLVVSCGYIHLSSSGGYICDQTYALCTSAQCIPDPNNRGRANCFCEVRKGKSFGNSQCHRRTPHTDINNITHIVSTFSLDDFASKRVMTCPSGSPWANCLDKICSVDPLNPKRALCACRLLHDGEFTTLGGRCRIETCKNGFWSGALTEKNAEYQDAMIKEMNLKESPQRSCRK